MPEIKHVFSQGKMNKDLDERLVPNGQYRDAMNIQVSTSEGSDVGTVQNLLGNLKLSTVAQNSTCVGAVADEKSNALYWFVTSSSQDAILEYKNGAVIPIFVDNNLNVLKFNSSNLITGINIIDNLLFWTDNVTEPKKINIDLCKQGTSNGVTHTKLVVPDRKITLSDGIKIREEHITVVKKSPKKELTLNISNENSVLGSMLLSFTNDNGDLLEVGDTFVYQGVNISFGNAFEEGEKIFLLDASSLGALPDDYDITVEVVSNISGTLPDASPGPQPLPYPSNSYIFRVLTVGVNVNSTLLIYNMQQGGNNIKFFDKKFVRFSYRYRYQDGEYSCFAPFSQVAFVPGNFNYQAKFAYNTGMENYLSKLVVSNYIQADILENVVQVDVLYKESNSPVVYLVDKIKFTDINTTSFINASGLEQSSNYWNANRYKINSDIIFAALPANQLIRPWDNVPRKALAQEVTGNRVVYGNYVQNYSINNALGDPQKPVISAGYNSRFYNSLPGDYTTKKSLKTLREYQIGIVYVDEYGRETPVFSNSAATFKIPKLQAAFSNKITTSVVTPHPVWAKGLKFYIKETANEYYNIAMDSVYRAEDGNLWLSFPSSERNKVDEETFLIFKKAQDKNELVTEEAKYKVIAINNEAPDFLKIKKREVVTTAGDISFQDEEYITGVASSTPAISFFFEGIDNYTPRVGSSSFVINKTNWQTPIGGVTLPNLTDIEEKISITFARTSDNTFSKTYDIIDITTDDNSDNYTISLDIPIREEDSFIYQDLDPEILSPDLGASGLDPTLEIIIHKYIKEQRPEFEGKFFVKINSDETVEEYAFSIAEGDVQYENSGTADSHYFSDNLAGGGTGTTGNDWTGVGHEITEYVNGQYQSRYGHDENSDVWVQPYSLLDPNYLFIDNLPSTYPTLGITIDQTNMWDTVLDVTGDGALDQSWFIDQAHFRGEAPLNYQIPSDRFPGGYGYGGNSGTGSNSQPGIYDGGINYVEHGVTKHIGGNYVTARDYWFSVEFQPAVATSVQRETNDSDFQQGVYEENGEWFIELSFSGIGEIPPYWKSDYFKTWSPTIDGEFSYRSGGIGGYDDYRPPHTNIGGLSTDEVWALPIEQQQFANQIKPGAFFTISGDDNETIYKINGAVQIFRRYNYVNWLDVLLADLINVTVARTTMADFSSSKNRRLTYKIPIKVLNGVQGANILDLTTGTSIGGSNILSAASQSNSIKINFKKVRYEESEKLRSNNPAIWETEPKESIDLDIYYEASQVYPLDVNQKSLKVLVSIGDELTSDVANAIASGTFVVGFNNTFIKLNKPVIDQSLFTQGDLITFTNQDGAYVKLSFDAFGSFGLSDYIKVSGAVEKEFGLAWSNCYSFGNGVESNRLRDDFNQVVIDKGAKASAPIEEVYQEERRKSGLIFSGLYNSTSGVNNLNQFIQAEGITKDLNPTYGSIQKLYSRNTDLIAFCQDRVLKILANKDAIFNADGNTNITATNRVLGQAMPFSGDFGISDNPESFAAENYRVYFTDKQKGAVLRLSMDGITPVSDYGMSDYFSDNLKLNTKIIGSYDANKNEYNVTLNSSLTTVSFNEKNNGWVSHKSFVPEVGVSMASGYYTFKKGDLYLHHAEKDFNNNSIDRNNFYGIPYSSSITLLLNDEPGLIKNYKTLNYEGSQSSVKQENSDVRTGYYNLIAKEGWSSSYIKTNKQEGAVKEFIEKEGKWFNFIKGKDVARTLDIKTEQFSFQGLGNAKSVTTDITMYIHAAVLGCMDVDANNYNPNATTDDGSCLYNNQILGCTDPLASNYNSSANVDDGSCTFAPIYGCTDHNSLTYNPDATIDDGSCLYINGEGDTTGAVYGCMDPLAANYNILATIDDGSCTYGVNLPGCTDPNANNYDPNAIIDDGSCTYNLTIQDISDDD